MWALDELERRTGSDWLERYWAASGHVPGEVNLGSAHVAAFGTLLELALRLDLLDGVPGAGKVQREMKVDLRDDRRRHCRLQLEVAALGARAGYTVAFENKLEPGMPPSDVALTRGPDCLRVETFAIVQARKAQEAVAYWESMSSHIGVIQLRHDVSVSGSISQKLSKDDTAELMRLIDQAAQETAATGEERTTSWRDAELAVRPTFGAGSHLEFGVETSDSWPRIASKIKQKAQQAVKAGGGWLRADLLDGSWVFTPWARASLRAKIDGLSGQVRPVLAEFPGIDGVILSNGAGLAQGAFYGESAAAAGECYGLCRPLPAVRVRETMIIPVSDRGRKQSRQWVDLYGSENSWLDWALSRRGLPLWDELRP